MSVEFVFADPNSDKAQEATHVVCRAAVSREKLPEELQDNVEGPCVECGTPLMWRPTSPDKPKICFACVFKTVAKSIVEKTLEAYEGGGLSDEEREGMDQLSAKVGLTRTPEAIKDVLDIKLAHPIPSPGDEHHQAFHDGTSFAMSLIFAVFHAEQMRGALADLSERHSDVLGAMLWQVDNAIESALRVGHYAEVEKAK